MHCLWVLDISKIPNTIKYIFNSGKKIIINEIFNEDVGIGNNFKSRNWFWKLYNLKFFSKASNILRIEILNKFGGIYFDLGFHIINDFNYYIDNFNYIFYYHKFNNLVVYPDITFFAIYPESNLINKYLNLFDNFDFLDNDTKNIFSTNIGFSAISGLYLLIVLFNSNIHTEEKILYFNDKRFYDLKQQSSWSGKCKFGGSNALEFEKIYKINNIFKEITKRDLLESDDILEKLSNLEEINHSILEYYLKYNIINSKNIKINYNNIEVYLKIFVKGLFKFINCDTFKDITLKEIYILIEKCIAFNSFDIKNIAIEILITFDRIFFIIDKDANNLLFIKIIYESIRNCVLKLICYVNKLEELTFTYFFKTFEKMLHIFKDNIKECLDNIEYLKELSIEEITILKVIASFIEKSEKYFSGIYDDQLFNFIHPFLPFLKK